MADLKRRTRNFKLGSPSAILRNWIFLDSSALKFPEINCKKLISRNKISQVGFAELKKTADDRANIGGTIIGAPIVGQQLAQYILTDHQDADYRPMIRLILSRQL